MTNSQRYLITKLAGLQEYPDRAKFVKGAQAGKDFMRDFINGAARNPRLAFVENGNNGTISKMASVLGIPSIGGPAVDGAMGAVKHFLGEPHGQELAALGLLAVPAAHHMMTGHSKTDKAMGAAELAGLGGLAVPGIQHFSGK